MMFNKNDENYYVVKKGIDFKEKDINKKYWL